MRFFYRVPTIMVKIRHNYSVLSLDRNHMIRMHSFA